MHVHIHTATSAADYAEGRRLFLEYAETLGFSLCFQGFGRELAVIDTMYAAPQGRLWIVQQDGHALGCGGIRRYDDHSAELKRMYLRPELRGLGLGQQLLNTALAATAELGYRSLRLDTVPGMKAAIALYHKNGFEVLDFQKAGDPEGLIYMERKI